MWHPDTCLYFSNIQVINVTILFSTSLSFVLKIQKLWLTWVSQQVCLLGSDTDSLICLASYSPYSSCIKLKTFVQRTITHTGRFFFKSHPSFTGFKSVWGWNPFRAYAKTVHCSSFWNGSKDPWKQNPKTKIRDLQRPFAAEMRYGWPTWKKSSAR